jgi:hypothetical protein
METPVQLEEGIKHLFGFGELDGFKQESESVEKS